MLKTALFISILGIVSLFIIAKNIEITSTTIEKINNEQITGDIIVSGIVKDVHSSDKFTTIFLSEDTELKAVAFSKLNLSIGDYIKIKGNYDENTFVIDELTKISN